MAVTIASELLDQIRARAAASPEVEVCGLLLGQAGQVEEARACHNVAADPTCRFEIDPAALLAAHRGERAGGAAIMGCYHSHPSGRAEPSACDAAAAAANGWLWLIVAGAEVRGWRATASGARHGRFDEADLT